MAADKKGQKYWKDNYAPKLVRDKEYLQRHYKGTRHSTEYYQRVYRDEAEASTREIAHHVKRGKDKPKVKKQKAISDGQSIIVVFGFIMYLIYLASKF